MNAEAWKLVAAIGGVLITAVTGPIIWAVRAEFGKVNAQLEILRNEIKIARAEIKTEMIEMEARLNERIDTRLVHR